MRKRNVNFVTFWWRFKRFWQTTCYCISIKCFWNSIREFPGTIRSSLSQRPFDQAQRKKTVSLPGFSPTRTTLATQSARESWEWGWRKRGAVERQHYEASRCLEIFIELEGVQSSNDIHQINSKLVHSFWIIKEVARTHPPTTAPTTTSQVRSRSNEHISSRKVISTLIECSYREMQAWL